MTPVTPFAEIQRAVAAYSAALQEWPPPYSGAGGANALGVAGETLGIPNRRARDRLEIGRALGLDVPHIHDLPADEARAYRRRYRREDAAFRAWEERRGPDAAARAAMRGETAAPPIPEHAMPPEGMVIRRHSVTLSGDGEVRAQHISTRPDSGEVYEPPPGHLVKGESTLLDATGRVVRRWVKTRDGALGAGLVEALEAVFARFEGAAPIAEAPTHTIADLHTIVPLADLHLGMYSWGRETGQNYDTDIAVDRARKTLRTLLAQAPQARSCTLLNLGDFFHANDARGVTPQSGHRLDVDGRWERVFERGVDLLLEMTDLLSQRYESVEVVILPGNHDPDSSVALRVALATYYRKHPRIQVAAPAGPYWYRQHGRCLFGAAHGDKIKMDRMAGTMAADCPKEWGATQHRSFFTAHIHHERAREDATVRIESFNTLAARDAYAHGGGWRSGHSLQAITYHAVGGEVMRHRVNVVPTTVRVKAGRSS